MWCGAWKMAKQDGNPLATMLLRQQKMAGSLPSPSLSPFALSPVVLVRARPSGAPIGQIRSLDRSHLLRFMHIFQKRKELPPFRSRWARRRKKKVEEEAKGERERKDSSVLRLSVPPRICMHAASSAGWRRRWAGRRETEGERGEVRGRGREEEKNRAICFRFTYLAREERASSQRPSGREGQGRSEGA